jgi:hypothetical protein
MEITPGLHCGGKLAVSGPFNQGTVGMDLPQGFTPTPRAMQRPQWGAPPGESLSTLIHHGDYHGIARASSRTLQPLCMPVPRDALVRRSRSASRRPIEVKLCQLRLCRSR